MNSASSFAATSSPATRVPARRTLWFAVTLAALVLCWWVPLRLLALIALGHEYSSHIPLIPVIAFGLLWLERDRLPVRRASGLGLVACLGAVSAALAWAGIHFSYRLGQNDYLAISVLAFVVAVWAAFILCYGKSGIRASLFPLLFLLLMVPIPDYLRTGLIVGLQRGSAEVCSWLFQLSGTPVFREDLIFTLPGIKIQVAEACSGIRSTIALLITTLLAGHLFLRSVRKEIVLVLVLLPVVIFKNALRIVTLTLLAVHWDPAFLRGDLHRDGGFLFFLLGVALLLPLFLWLYRRPVAATDPPRPSSAPATVRRTGAATPTNT